MPVLRDGKKQFDPEILKRFHEGIAYLNTFLSDYSYCAGNKLTIADLAIVASISAYHVSKYATCNKVIF